MPPRNPTAGKAELRALLLSRRREVPATLHGSEAGGLAVGAVAACALIPADAPATVCAYVPVHGEPGSAAMLDAVRASGRQVLLPVLPLDGAGRAAPDRPLHWAPYLGVEALVAGPYGLRQPAGPDLGPSAISDAGLVLVPALAVDRRGVRLGRGAGWYDRSLPLVRPGTPLLAVVRDEEVLDEVPDEPHDVRMTGVLTPTAGPRTFPTRLL